MCLQRVSHAGTPVAMLLRQNSNRARAMRYDLDITNKGGLGTAVDIGQVLGRLEADLAGAETNSGPSVDASETVAALRLAMLAMSEAEQRIERQQRASASSSLSSTDELTGLHNRWGFHQELKRALAQANRTGTGGVLIMLDLDQFKAVNDTYGHAAGDAILKTVGRTLKRAFARRTALRGLGVMSSRSFCRRRLLTKLRAASPPFAPHWMDARCLGTVLRCRCSPASDTRSLRR